LPGISDENSFSQNGEKSLGFGPVSGGGMGSLWGKYLSCQKPLYRGNQRTGKVGAGDVLSGKAGQLRSLAYFLPEKKNEGKGKIYADTVIDGEVTELKTVPGNRSILGTDFKQGYKQEAALVKGRIDAEKHSVYIYLLSDISLGSVKAKIAGELKDRPALPRQNRVRRVGIALSRQPNHIAINQQPRPEGRGCCSLVVVRLRVHTPP
jgi:hypothetical protein